MIQQFDRCHGDVLGFKMSGQLHDSDYQGFVPLVERVIARHGKARLLLQFEDFEGWDLAALWDDLKFTAQHYRDIERFAIVGEGGREEMIASIGRSFTQGEVRYFEASELEVAWAWLEEGDKTVPVGLAEPAGPVAVG